MKYILIAFLCIVSWANNAQVAKMLQDLNPGELGSRPVNRQIISIGDKVFFTALTATVSEELFVSNGTPAGTKLVKDINPGVTLNSNIGHFNAFKGKLIFSANDGINGNELWISDGTEAGTTMIKDFFPGSGSGIASTAIRNVIVHNDFVYLFAQKEGGKIGLWKSDGTTIGTKELFASLSANTNPDQLTVFNNSIYFFAITDVAKGGKLHKLDLNSEQVSIIDDPNLGSINSIEELTVCGSRMYFSASLNFGFGKEPCYSDGTANGTNLLKNLVNPGSSNPTDFTFLGGNKVVFFTSGAVYVTDGTSSGTVALNAFGRSDVRPVKNSANQVYFSGSLFGDTKIGNELFVTDGTISGTKLVKDIYPDSSKASAPTNLFLLNNKIYFSAIGDANNSELWESDGTSIGTKLFVEINPGVEGSFPSIINAIKSNLFFFAFHPNFGFEPTYIDLSTSVSNQLIYSDLNIQDNLDSWLIKLENSIEAELVYELIDLGGKVLSFGSVKNMKNFEIRKPESSGVYFIRVFSKDYKLFGLKKLIRS